MVPEAYEFAVDASVAPGGVLGGEVDDELSELGCDGWSSRSSRGLCPAARDTSPVPSQEGIGGDDPAGSSSAGERCRDGAEQGPVLVVEVGSVDLSAEDAELVAHHDEFEVFGPAGAYGEPRQAGDEAVENARHS